MAKRKVGKVAEKAREARKRKRHFRQQVWGFVKDILVALAVVAIVMVSMFVYSGGIWPPMVVVESESMMHGEDSQIGVIDTGDLTLVKKVSSKSDIVTYVEGRPSYTVSFEEAGKPAKEETFKGAHPGFKTYGDYGEVIIYRKNGDSGQTPVIHRAMAWFVPNTTTECKNSLPMGYVAGGDFPDIRNSAHPTGLKCVVHLSITNVGYKKDTLVISVNVLVAGGIAVDGSPIAGFLTKGDHNSAGSGQFRCDQETHYDNKGKRFAPNKVEWIVGKAVGELPWFGSLKLVASKTTPSDKIPPSSWKGLVATIVLIIVIPFLVDIAAAQYSKHKAKKKGKPSEERVSEPEDEEDDKKASGNDDAKDELIDEAPDNEEYDEEFKKMASKNPQDRTKKTRK